MKAHAYNRGGLMIGNLLAALAAIECFGIMILEMFFWESAGSKINPDLRGLYLLLPLFLY